MKKLIIVLLLACMCTPAVAQLNAGVARISITPLEVGMTTPLGGYGARAGKPAEGIHDTIYAKALVFERGGEKSALVALDVCGLPIGLVEDSVAKAGIDGLTLDRVMMAASHTHAGLEGFALDRRNIANNPHIGIFSEELLQFVTERLAQCLREADSALQPVRAGAGQVRLPDMNRNRRNAACVDEDLTVLRLDLADGAPYVALVNYTAHGTIMTEREMLVSGGWAGVMQRTVEALTGPGVTCLFVNGALGDISPKGAQGGSRWEMAEYYGRRVGIHAARLWDGVKTADVDRFTVRSEWLDLPTPRPAPDFVKIAGSEYHVTQEQLEMLLPVMFPSRAPLYALRVNDFQMITFPGEPICEIGGAIKEVMRGAGVAYPCVASLTTDSIGYILTPEEYRRSGYEVTASFYGETLGTLMQEKAIALATQ